MLQPVHHRRQSIGLRAIVRLASFATMPYQLCPLQHRQVFRDSRLRYACIAGQCVNGLLPLPGQLFEDRPASRICESSKDVIGVGCFHTQTIAKWLWFRQEIYQSLFAMAVLFHVNARESQSVQHRSHGRLSVAFGIVKDAVFQRRLFQLVLGFGASLGL